MKISLREFIATGKFGDIELGMTRTQVVEFLGVPKNWSTPDSTPDTAVIWKYGDIEFYFQADKLWMIFTDDFEVPRGCEQFELDTWEIKRDCTPDEMERHLLAAGIAYGVEDFPYVDNGVRLISVAGTTMTFGNEDSGKMEMFSVFNSTLAA